MEVDRSTVAEAVHANQEGSTYLDIVRTSKAKAGSAFLRQTYVYLISNRPCVYFLNFEELNLKRSTFCSKIILRFRSLIIANDASFATSQSSESIFFLSCCSEIETLVKKFTESSKLSFVVKLLRLMSFLII